MCDRSMDNILQDMDIFAEFDEMTETIATLPIFVRIFKSSSFEWIAFELIVAIGGCRFLFVWEWRCHYK